MSRRPRRPTPPRPPGQTPSALQSPAAASWGSPGRVDAALNFTTIERKDGASRHTGPRMNDFDAELKAVALQLALMTGLDDLTLKVIAGCALLSWLVVAAGSEKIAEKSSRVLLFVALWGFLVLATKGGIALYRVFSVPWVSPG